MELCKFIKKEPEIDNCYEIKTETYESFESYLTFDYMSCGIKIECKEEFPNVQDSSQNLQNTAHSPNLKFSIPAIPLEHSHNQEVLKNVDSQTCNSTSSAELHSKTSKELNLHLKTESVELETLNEKTLKQSPKYDRYALPWDFVDVRHAHDNENLKNAPKVPTKRAKSPALVRSELYEGKMNKSPKCNERNRENLTCKICDRPFQYMSLLTQHIQTHNKSNYHECDTCGKKFKLKQCLQKHLRSHESKTYSYDECHRTYKRKSTLRQHIKTHSLDSLDNWLIRQTKLTENTQLTSKNHKEDEKKSTIDKESAKSSNGGRVDTKEPKKTYVCDICGERFKKKSSLAVHIEFLHIEILKEHDEKLKPSSSKSNIKRPYPCSICGKRFTQTSHVGRHKKASHSGSKPHTCKLCNEGFSTTSSLKRHMLNKHNDTSTKGTNHRNIQGNKLLEVKNFTCKICDKSFICASDLRRHCAIHDARKPYECDICKKQFRIKSYLYAHILTHDNWRPYPCHSCPKLYRRKSSLQRHVQINHSVKTKYNCSDCWKSYKHLVSYRSHMKKCHGVQPSKI
ncbi:zinc finger protein 25-like [Neodiprion pinetum]|uniref:zinc finger protein 25-like n=1 Tax=Neodiprion pinetum TaxID=441929 RepID=UPI001EE0B7EE|nr:zinc finger protein 852-like [Neodiprion pinetum]XP_046491352.1 zinc finger protein 852-like [Neodiprion pinetum]XP_046491353.1 zinc finger protein 852-like [Neodiprion pinetum]XP_046491354.1 zinc finger protein 852-like [Neodiprion pinetum]XP_046491355.1 zinc finger protein 852-like [Neodiprion pinetum]XP_046491356.1 zinc finger protein 852-like [Neodiprion pinetum]